MSVCILQIAEHEFAQSCRHYSSIQRLQEGHSAILRKTIENLQLRIWNTFRSPRARNPKPILEPSEAVPETVPPPETRRSKAVKVAARWRQCGQAGKLPRAGGRRANFSRRPNKLDLQGIESAASFAILGARLPFQGGARQTAQPRLGRVSRPSRQSLI